MSPIPTKAPNPLEVLGVPRSLIVREYSQGAPERLMRITEATYRTLSKLYHPDMPGGDAAVMASLTQARNELDDVESLEYYASELIESKDIDQADRTQLRERLEAQRTEALHAATRLLAYSNQFEIMGINQPTSFLVAFGNDRLVVQVLSETHTTMSVASSASFDELPSLFPRYSNGVWSESTTLEDSDTERIYYSRINLQGGVRIIGGVEPQLDDGETSAPDLSSAWELDQPLNQGISWASPFGSWFMPRLRSYHQDDQLVLMKGDLVAITGAVLASATI